jgi:FkbM family methyltransferase
LSPLRRARLSWGRWSSRARHRLAARRLAGHKLLRAFADTYPEALFIEIGANDGDQGDHLRPLILANAWRGIMVEPHPEAFRRLCGSYGALDRVILENVAIADRDDRLPLYQVLPPTGGERWELVGSYDQLSSLSRETLLGHRWIADRERRIVRTDVECVRFDSLCRKHGVETIDLLLIDTEGYDYEVIKQVDLRALRPRLLVYEHCLLTRRDRDECNALLRAHGYELMEEHFNTWCLDPSVRDSLSARWRGLRPAGPGVSLRADD